MALNRIAMLLLLAALVYGAVQLGRGDFGAAVAVSRLVEGIAK